jgi:hypothetical protein
MDYKEKLGLIFEHRKASTKEVLEFIGSSFGEYKVRENSRKRIYVTVNMEIKPRDIISTDFEQFGWYVKGVGLGDLDRAIELVPLIGHQVQVPTDDGKYVYHVTNNPEKIKSEGIVPKESKGDNGVWFFYYPPRTFVWTARRNVGSSNRTALDPDTFIAVIDPTGMKFYHDEQYDHLKSGSIAAYTLDTISPDRFKLIKWKDFIANK